MLVLKCAACKKKLWRYDKIGPGELLRCHKARIDKIYACNKEADTISCRCGRQVGIDKGSYYKMITKNFTASGDKRRSPEKNKRQRHLQQHIKKGTERN